MFRSLILAAALLAFTPLAANAAKSPCCPQLNYRLAIAMITVTTGTVVAGATGITGTTIMNGVKIAGGAMTTAIIAAGISVKRMNAVIGKAGAIATIIAGEAGVTNIITKPPAE